MTAPASGRNRSRPAATCRRCNFRIIACSGIRTARRRSVKNGAGLLANPPRFLPLLAGPSFHGSGIGPESFAAKRGGKDASGTSRKHRSLRSPPRGGLGRTKRQQKTRRLPGCKHPAPLKPRRSSGRSQGLGRTKRLKGPAVAGLRRSLPPKDSDTPRARTAECFMYSR